MHLAWGITVKKKDLGIGRENGHNHLKLCSNKLKLVLFHEKYTKINSLNYTSKLLRWFFFCANDMNSILAGQEIGAETSRLRCPILI